MEVHHHPHVEKKGFKEYFLEFIMIFLAVTLGFIAENLREHISESHLEKEYAQQLYTELKDDSVAAVNNLSIRLDKERDMDYLYNFFKNDSLASPPKKFYPAFTTSFYLINSYAFEPKDGILSQLRNSGSLRYFKSVTLQKLIGDISVCIYNLRFRNDQEYQFFANPVKPFLLEHYDFSWLDKLRNADPKPYFLDLINNYRNGNSLIPGEILNPSTINRSETCNMIMFYKQMLVATQSLQLTNYIITNHNILQALRDNYSLEN